MQAFFERLGSIQYSINEYIVEAIENFGLFLAYLSKSVPVVLKFADFVPHIIGMCISMVVCTAVIKLIIGR